MTRALLAPQQAAPGRWWNDRATVARYLSDLLHGELARLRPGGGLSLHGWSALADGDAGADDIPVDSLELMSLATAVTEATHLHAAGIEDYLLVRRSFGAWLDIVSAGLDAYSATLTFRTSGSTGSPKACAHSLLSLLQEGAGLAELLPGRRRVLVAVPAHHIYGFLFTILLPRALGLDEAEIIDLRASSPGALGAAAQPGDLVIGHPAYWEAVARGSGSLGPDVVGVTSTAPCPDATAVALERIGLGRLVQVYGSSETAGIGWRDAIGKPFTLFPWWTFTDIAGHDLVRSLPDGTSAKSTVADHLSMHADGRQFDIGGRRDEAVQVGGTNVFPQQVAAVLSAHPLVRTAAVRSMLPHEGQRLKAFIVPADPTACTDHLRAVLTNWIDAHLPVAQRPRALSFGSELPSNADGKLIDWPVA